MLTTMMKNDMTNTFKWVIHTTKNARKLGCKKNSFNVNQKLPIELAIDNKYELELCEIIGGEERRYKKNALEITETDAYKLTKVDGKIKKEKIPGNYFEGRYKWLSYQIWRDIKSRLSELLPLLLWGLLLPLTLHVLSYTPPSEITQALNMLISQNASKATVFISCVGFSSLGIIYLFIIEKGSHLKKAIELLMNQIFGLIICASSFGIASAIISVAQSDKKTETNLCFEIFLPLLICILSYCGISFLNEVKKYHKKFSASYFIALIILSTLFSQYFSKNKTIHYIYSSSYNQTSTSTQ